ncbi:MAG: 30S ribosomal protein S20 [bacterium]
MPNLKAAEKALRQTKKHLVLNQAALDNISKLRTQIKHALSKKETDKVKELWKALQKAVDKAIKNNVYKKSSGSRIKSRVAKLIAKVAK